MNIKELKALLEYYPEDLEVWSLCEGYGNAFVTEREDIRLVIENDGGVRKVVLLIGKE